jgi:uncharacterized protein (DUF2235 family)
MRLYRDAIGRNWFDDHSVMGYNLGIEFIEKIMHGFNKDVFIKITRQNYLYIFLGLVFSLSNCAQTNFRNDSSDSLKEVQIELEPFTGDASRSKNVFIFLDGTLNDSNSGTNVRRLYEALQRNPDPQKLSIYIPGVGTLNKPATGAVLGRGMEERISRGYEFITRNYGVGDKLYIFGFSRGAHQARALAGLLSYAGIPVIPDSKKDSYKDINNKIIDLLKESNDADYLEKWRSWAAGNPPVFSPEIKKELDIDMTPVEVSFLGIWDTVPGSFFKKYDVCKEKIGFFKRNFSWIPGISKGHRYKSDSYPPIHNIVHAVSIDEKRSMFAPILTCPAISQGHTNISEVWFPGAHADVGGGYPGSNELPDLSLSWMIELLGDVYQPGVPGVFEGRADGLAHWSIDDTFSSIGSDCENRELPDNAIKHSSYQGRKAASPVNLLLDGKIQKVKYPKYCGE